MDGRRSLSASPTISRPASTRSILSKGARKLWAERAAAAAPISPRPAGPTAQKRRTLSPRSSAPSPHSPRLCDRQTRRDPTNPLLFVDQFDKNLKNLLL